MKIKTTIKTTIKRAISVTLLAALAVSIVPETASAKWEHKSKYDYTYETGALWWKKTWHCKAYKASEDLMRCYYGKPTVEAGWTYKKDKTADIVISQSTSFSIGSETVYSMNSDVELEEAGVKLGFGSSISRTNSQSFGISQTVTRTVAKSKRNGYYNFNVCMNIDNWKVTGTSEGTVYFSTAKSQPYTSLIYSPTCNYSDAVRA